jgi:hypothetical protein
VSRLWLSGNGLLLLLLPRYLTQRLGAAQHCA